MKYIISQPYLTKTSLPCHAHKTVLINKNQKLVCIVFNKKSIFLLQFNNSTYIKLSIETNLDPCGYHCFDRSVW